METSFAFYDKPETSDFDILILKGKEKINYFANHKQLFVKEGEEWIIFEKDGYYFKSFCRKMEVFCDELSKGLITSAELSECLISREMIQKNIYYLTEKIIGEHNYLKLKNFSKFYFSRYLYLQLMWGYNPFMGSLPSTD